ncbi:MAG: DUF2089 domain-containing protein [Clostridia bacterium]|nr:DUF2089 domain-containing protein [Clostridia bacterium]
MAKEVKMLASCPCCGGKLTVSELTCAECGTKISGNFALPAFAGLSEEAMHFVAGFMRNSGNMRDVQAELRLSYPTVRKILDRVALAFGAAPQTDGEPDAERWTRRSKCSKRSEGRL